MVQDGNPIETKTAGKWLLPFYGLWNEYEICTAINNCSNSTQGNAIEASAVIALAENVDETMTAWAFHGWVNTGRNVARNGAARPTGGCAPSNGTYW